MSVNPLLDQVEKFKYELKLRSGTIEQGLVVLFAYATEASPQRPALTVYLDAMLGPPKRMDHVGKLDYKILDMRRTSNGMLHARIGLTADQVRVVNSILSGTHPLSTAQADDKFDFATGKEICYLGVHFEDGCILSIDVERQLDFIGVGCYLMRDVNLIDSLPPIGSSSTILGNYFLSVADNSDLPEGAPIPFTHGVTIEQLP